MALLAKVVGCIRPDAVRQLALKLGLGRSKIPSELEVDSASTPSASIPEKLESIDYRNLDEIIDAFDKVPEASWEEDDSRSYRGVPHSNRTEGSTQYISYEIDTSIEEPPAESDESPTEAGYEAVAPVAQTPEVDAPKRREQSRLSLLLEFATRDVPEDVPEEASVEVSSELDSKIPSTFRAEVPQRVGSLVERCIAMHPLADAAVLEDTTPFEADVAPTPSNFSVSPFPSARNEGPSNNILTCTQETQASSLTIALLRFQQQMMSSTRPEAGNAQSMHDVPGSLQSENAVVGTLPILKDAENSSEGTLQSFRDQLSGAAESENIGGGGVQYFRDLLSGSALTQLSLGRQPRKDEATTLGGTVERKSSNPSAGSSAQLAQRKRIITLGEPMPEEQKQQDSRTSFPPGSMPFAGARPLLETSLGSQEPELGSTDRPRALLGELGDQKGKVDLYRPSTDAGTAAVTDEDPLRPVGGRRSWWKPRMSGAGARHRAQASHTTASAASAGLGSSDNDESLDHKAHRESYLGRRESILERRNSERHLANQLVRVDMEETEMDDKTLALASDIAVQEWLAANSYNYYDTFDQLTQAVAVQSELKATSAKKFVLL